MCSSDLAPVPVFADALLGRDGGDVFAEFRVQNVPPAPDVFVQRVRFVLDEDGDPAQAGVEAVAQREVDDSVFAAEGHGRLGALFGERGEPFAFAAGQDHREDIVHRGEL